MDLGQARRVASRQRSRSQHPYMPAYGESATEMHANPSARSSQRHTMVASTNVSVVGTDASTYLTPDLIAAALSLAKLAAVSVISAVLVCSGWSVGCCNGRGGQQPITTGPLFAVVLSSAKPTDHDQHASQAPLDTASTQHSQPKGFEVV